MKAFAVLLLCVASVLAVPHQRSEFVKVVPWKDAPSLLKGNRIIGGSPAVEAQIPYQVALIAGSADGAWLCGGSLISTEWVLTAAHCVIGATVFNVYMGGLTFSTNEPGVVLDITYTGVAHADFSWETLNNDIGLVRLSAPVELNERIQPVRLPESGTFIEAGQPLTVSGWGRTSDTEGGASTYLNYVNVEAISNEECAAVYGNAVIVDSTLCTRGMTNEGVCSGDSGGPLVSYEYDDIEESYNITARLQGVVSFTAAVGCEAGFPSGFVRVTELLDWISENTGLSL
ncbi:Trypsin [Popillia japonica]|uniref:Trypsin n=1 Tax=Popillia japonica TaxID=7064 RepID=A0AAW1MBG1_POPJA